MKYTLTIKKLDDLNYEWTAGSTVGAAKIDKQAGLWQDLTITYTKQVKIETTKPLETLVHYIQERYEEFWPALKAYKVCEHAWPTNHRGKIKEHEEVRCTLPFGHLGAHKAYCGCFSEDNLENQLEVIYQ